MSRASDRRQGRTWPGYLLGGRVRTSTVVLLIAFFATWWLFDTYQPAPAPPEQVPAPEVVPPGFIPDPAYTWAPRSDVQSRPPATSTTTPTTTDTQAPTTEPSTSPEVTPGAPLPPGASTPGPSTPVETRLTETLPASTPPAASSPPISTPQAPVTATSPTPAPPAR